MTGIVVFAHGSTVEAANVAVQETSAKLASAGKFDLVETSFLELGHPDLSEAVRRLVSRGANRIVIVPYFLTLGIHLQRDLPRIVENLQNIYKGVQLEVTEPLDGHPALVQALLDRARNAVQHGGSSSEGQVS